MDNVRKFYIPLQWVLVLQCLIELGHQELILGYQLHVPVCYLIDPHHLQTLTDHQELYDHLLVLGHLVQVIVLQSQIVLDVMDPRMNLLHQSYRLREIFKLLKIFRKFERDRLGFHSVSEIC